MSKKIVLSHERLIALEHELEDLRTVKRKEVAEKIKVARSFGDLSENSEYDEAKNEQGFIESRIIQLESMLKNASEIDESDLTFETVAIGCHVKIVDSDGDEDDYDIVGSLEADPTKGRISDESPVGSALLQKKVGEEVEVTVPSGAKLTYKVLEISRQKH